MILRLLVIGLLPLPLCGCPLLATFGLSAIGGGTGALTTARLVETDTDLAIRLAEDGGCIVEAKDRAHGEKVTALTAELCAALQLEQKEAIQ